MKRIGPRARRVGARALLAWVALGATASHALVERERAPVDARIVVRSAAPARLVEVDPADPTAEGAAARAFLQRHGGRWRFTFDAATGRPVLVQGSGIPLVPGRGNAVGARGTAGLPVSGGGITVDALAPLVAALVERQGALLAPARGRLELDRATSAVRADGRLASLYFRWLVDDVPVEGATVFVRLNSGNVTQLGAPGVAEVAIDTKPTVDAASALRILLEHAGDAAAHRVEEPPRLRIEPASDGTGHRLVWVMTYTVPGRIETWEGRIDAHRAEVVGFRDVNAYGRVVGGVYPRTVYDADETTVALPFAAVEGQAGNATGDAAGGFAYSGGTAGTALAGRWFALDCQACSDPAQPSVQTDLGSGRLDLGTGGADAAGNGRSTPSDRNTFYHLNQARRIALKWLPGLPWLDTTVLTRTNIQKSCNAYWDGAVNFMRSSATCNNTGEIADVIVHEWGHGIDQNTRLGDGATGEGTSDVAAMQLSHSPLVGPGFRRDGEPVRNLDPAGPRGLLTTTNVGLACPLSPEPGPLGYEVHCEGEIYGQAAWELAQALVARHGHHTGWRISERLFFESLPDAGGYLPTSSLPIYAAYLNADDDDGNLANGTPHAAEIHAAFDRHGIAGAALPASAHCARPAQPALTVTPACDGFDLQWSTVPGVDRYEVFRAELRSDQALFHVATVSRAQTAYFDSRVAPATDYGYVVMAVAPGECESTIEDPVPAWLPERPALSLAAAIVDDAPRGNRSGYADPGEEVDLRLTLRNEGSAASAAVHGTLEALTAGVAVLEGQAGWPALAPGAEAVNQSVLRFGTDASLLACGSLLRFRVEPGDGAGCPAAASYFEVPLGDPSGVCDPTPPCYVEPTFAGLTSAAPGASCGEADLAWAPGSSHCADATIAYDVHRSTEAGFSPGAATRVAAGIAGSSFTDSLLEPGRTYHYVVRAVDSRSGQDANTVARSVAASAGPDLRPPLFDGLVSASTGAACGEIELQWGPALDSCGAPVSFEIYRGTFAGFVPGPQNRIGSALSTTFVDAALDPHVDYTYVVRARDTAGNEEANEVRATATSGSLDRVTLTVTFDRDREGWSAVAPNDATTGNWAWGSPEPTDYQAGSCARGAGCWITGLPASLPGGNNNDVDEGTTTLLSARYDTSAMVHPALSYRRWFTNDRGASPGEDPLVVEISDDDGASWTELESVGAGTPLEWVLVERAFPVEVAPSSATRLRFTAADLGAGSLVEAGVDELALIDYGQGCNFCGQPAARVAEIGVARGGADLVIDWADDGVPTSRFVVYASTSPSFAGAVRIGATAGHAFVHEGAAAMPSPFYYRVSRVDPCGQESTLD